MDIKKDKYITILNWMNDITDTIEERDIFALIYGFCQDEESCFKGSLSYLMSWTKCKSKNTVKKTLLSLEEKGLIIKYSTTMNGVVFNRYVVDFDMCQKLTESKFDIGGQNLTGGVSKFDRGVSKFDPNNNRDNTIDNNSNISSSTIVTEDNVFNQDKSFLKTTQSHNNVREGEEVVEVEDAMPRLSITERKIREREKREKKFTEELDAYKVSFGGEFDDDMVDAFVLYWTEPNQSKTKMRWEKEKVFDKHRRLLTWQRNDYGKRSSGTQQRATCGNGQAMGNGNPQYSGGVNQMPYVRQSDIARQSYADITRLAHTPVELDF